MRYSAAIRIVAMLLCTIAFFGAFGCESRSENVISGGTTDRTDYNAPKVIQSETITSFQAEFYIATRYMKEDNGFFDFTIAPDENGVLTVSESYRELALPADDTLLAALQSVIRKYDLAQMNGVYRVTAGLAPECQRCHLNVCYDSGEQLTFTTNNNPFEEWTTEFFDVLSEWFFENGVDALLPESELKQRFCVARPDTRSKKRRE